MKYRKFGNTDLNVSEIGFGTWGLGGDSYGSISKKKCISLLNYAFDNKINFYDTANLYGMGRSEELLGTVFKNKRESIIYSSKAGFLDNDNQDFSVQSLTDSLENSLKRLKTDYIDFFQLHNPDEKIVNDELVGLFQKFKKDGKIRYYGLAARSPQDAFLLLNRYNFDGIQINFNLLDLRAWNNGLFKLCKDKKIGIICRTPLIFGFLTPKPNIKKKNDHRHRFDKQKQEKWIKASDLIAQNTKLKNITQVQNALRFCLSFDEISTTIPGVMNVSEIKENIKSVGINYFTQFEKELVKNINKELEL